MFTENAPNRLHYFMAEHTCTPVTRQFLANRVLKTYAMLIMFFLLSLMQTVVAPWLDKPKEDLEVKKFKGESVSFTCAAQGFPLQVEWKFQKRGEDIVQSCISECGQLLV